jgi:hypothetical protein
MHEEACAFIAENPRDAAAWLNAHGLGELHGGARRVVDNGLGGSVIDWNLRLNPTIDFATVKAFIARHHRHCKPPRGWRFGAGLHNGSDLVAVVGVGRTTSRAYNPKTVVEVNRLTVRGDLPPELGWNACSMLLGWAAREAKRRGFHRIQTYTLVDESGTSLRAAGWTLEARVKGRSWNTPSRPRDDHGPLVDKHRWSKVLFHDSSVSRTHKTGTAQKMRNSLQAGEAMWWLDQSS